MSRTRTRFPQLDRLSKYRDYDETERFGKNARRRNEQGRRTIPLDEYLAQQLGKEPEDD